MANALGNAAASAASTGTHILVNGVLTSAAHTTIDTAANATKVVSSAVIGASAWLISTAIIYTVSTAATGAYYAGMWAAEKATGSAAAKAAEEEEERRMIAMRLPEDV